MKAQAKRAPSALRAFGWLTGAFGWILALALGASRLLLAAPHDEGVLIAGLALALFCLMTSATLLVLQALGAGFGALDSFFTAALARAAQRPAQPAPLHEAETPRRGFIGNRPYVLRRDGAVEVETLFGPRLFSSLADAEDFIGA